MGTLFLKWMTKEKRKKRKKKISVGAKWGNSYIYPDISVNIDEFTYKLIRAKNKGLHGDEKVC